MKIHVAPSLALLLLTNCSPVAENADNKTQSQGSQAIVSVPDSQEVKDITNAVFSERSANCSDYVSAFTSQVKDINENKAYTGNSQVTVANGKCTFTANAIPNHDFNDGARSFVNPISAQQQTYEITATPIKAATPTPLTLQYDNAIFLNGVKVDLLAAGCFGVGDGKIGCNDISQPWRYDPMNEAGGFGTDSHNAHTQPNGAYHYHGDPQALYRNTNADESPVIGFAADGFPIYGPFVKINGEIRRAKSSYQLKTGARPTGNGNPGGNYDGTFVDDFEYKAGSGDLDACNGMEKDGNYGYYITETYPHVLKCFTGTPDESFRKGGGGGQGPGQRNQGPPQRN